MDISIKRFRNLCGIYILINFFSCTHYSDLELALRQAGDNRFELEKVLNYYQQKAEDSLKYKAACFLISNMPEHYELCSKQIDTIRAGLRKGLQPSKEETNYLASSVFRIYDINKITSDYLIDNIEFSFKIWEEAPWSKNISFSDFCEHILPYRINDEPLERWKEEYYHYFRSIIETTDYELAEFCRQLIARLQKDQWFSNYELSYPGLGALALLHGRYGGCKEQADFITYVLRSLGIPSGVDKILQSANSQYSSHFWNYIRVSENQLICVEYFLVNDTSLLAPARKYGKIYRLSYAIQKESLPERYKVRDIPERLRNPFLQDVSHQYFPDTGVSLPIDPQKIKNEILYLCVYNGEKWVPVAYAEVLHDSIAFRNMETDVLYQIASISKNKCIEIIPPFVYKADGTTLFIEADTIHLQTMDIRRKYKLPWWWESASPRSIGGKFQGANNPDFGDVVTLHLISEPMDGMWKTVAVDHSGSNKYIRYLSAENGYNQMAEMEFYSGEKRLTGSIIGTEPSDDGGSDNAKEQTMDGDPLTYYWGDLSGSWAGMEFEKPQRITKIKYLFRNDDNYIRPGDTYEFFYYKKGIWISTGKTVADTTYLLYDNIPSGTLYFLKNHTRGKEERLFTYENGKQVFW